MRFARYTSLALSFLTVACVGDIDGDQTPDEGKEGDELGIIGGRTEEGHPSVVGVGDASGAFCTGTVISKRTVITAGHCFTPGQTNGGITRVFFGQNLNGGTVTVAQAIRHPGFNNNTLANDLAILRLATDALSQPAPILRETMNNTGVFIGPKFTFVGYGVSNGTSQTGFGTKRVVTFPIAAVGPASVGGTPGSIDATQFYYKVPGKNTCNGDSGGPAFAIRNGLELHAGTTSFGDGPCTLDGVQARTDAPAISNFIQPNINTFESTNACKSDGTCTAGCNVNGQLGDPDCAAQHRGADGVCVAAATPVDPDCNLGIDYCDNDGMCKLGCATPDVDCADQGVNNPQNPVCGNGAVETGEQCDDGNTVNTDACLNTCVNARCGDGILRGGVEACDDGNNLNGDGCDGSCNVEVPTQGSFEKTVTGPINIPDNNQTGVTSTIAVPAGVNSNKVTVSIDIDHTFRGDLVVDLTAPNGRVVTLSNRAGGSADDIVINNFDITSQVTPGSSATGNWRLRVRDLAAIDTGRILSWTLKINIGINNPVCGNGTVEASEQCDDGNTVNTDACLNSCVTARCGDGVLRAGVEACDDGNIVSGDGCSASCAVEQPQPGDSCEGRCGEFDANEVCQCDSQCAQFGDCCEDLADVCQ
jgi:cysteine-rich repeat protein